MKNFANEPLKKHIKNSGRTQGQLADEIGICRENLVRFISGNIRPQNYTVYRFLDVLNLTDENREICMGAINELYGTDLPTFPANPLNALTCREMIASKYLIEGIYGRKEISDAIGANINASTNVLNGRAWLDRQRMSNFLHLLRFSPAEYEHFNKLAEQESRSPVSPLLSNIKLSCEENVKRRAPLQCEKPNVACTRARRPAPGNIVSSVEISTPKDAKLTQYDGACLETIMNSLFPNHELETTGMHCFAFRYGLRHGFEPPILQRLIEKAEITNCYDLNIIKRANEDARTSRKMSVMAK